MRIAVINLQIIETNENIENLSEAEKKLTHNKSTVVAHRRIAINHVFVSNTKAVEYFEGMVDKYRSTIL